MPLYSYNCQDCGPFDAFRRMAEVKAPMPCPDCEAIAMRVFTAPSVNLNSGSLFKRTVSEEPRLVKREGEPAKPQNQSPRSGSRPWMLGHATERL
jgi:putative FmdB family regulatory protein